LNLPNKLSLLRIILIPLLVYVLLSGLPYSRFIGIAIFVIVALTDYFDGYIARKLDQVTKLGMFLDPLADKLLLISVMLCLVELDLISTIPVMIVVIRDFAVTGLRLSAASSGRIIAADRLGKYKAALLDVAVVLLLLEVPGSVTFLWITVLISVVSGISYFEQNWKVLNG